METTRAFISRLIFLICFTSSMNALAVIEPSVFINKLQNEIDSAGDDSIRIEKLFELASFYSDYSGDEKQADSLCNLAVLIAEMTHRPLLIFNAYNRYIEIITAAANASGLIQYAGKAGELPVTRTSGMDFRLSKNLANIRLSAYEYDKALEYSYKCLSIAMMANDNGLKAESHLLIGRSLEGRNQKIEAFRNYLDALSLSERISDKRLLGLTYSSLSRFFNLNRIYSKAIHYKVLQQELILKTVPIDSIALAWTWYDLQEIDLNSDNNRLNDQSTKRILDFAERWEFEKLLEFEIALVRTHYIESEQIGKLQDLYYNRFPQKMEKLNTENPGLYARLKAYFFELNDQTDSAFRYFSRAERIYRDHPNKILQSNFYSRFGEFLARTGMTEEAVKNFKIAFMKASEASFFDFMLGASRKLEDIYAGKKDFENAYHYSLQNKSLTDSLARLARNDQLLSVEIEHEARQREINAEAVKKETDRRHYLQYTAIMIVIITIFIILLMLGSLKVPEWIIRTLGFFSFIFLFEFIILIADHRIHALTHGEPWKILLIKIFLIAILLPFHHWVEKRVIAFLLDPKLVNIARYPLRSKLKEHIIRVKKNRGIRH